MSAYVAGCPVTTDTDGTPRVVVIKGTRRAVDVIQEKWRIDEGWGRPNPVSRLYFRVVLANGAQVIVFRDLLNDTWWTQR